MNRQRADRVGGLGVLAGSVVLALAASLFMLFGARVTTETGAATGFGATTEADGATSAGDSSIVRGSEDAIPLSAVRVAAFSVPVVVAAAPLLSMRRRKIALGLRIASTGLLFLWMLFLASSGMFYAPAAAAMALAAALAADGPAEGQTPPATPIPGQQQPWG